MAEKHERPRIIGQQRETVELHAAVDGLEEKVQGLEEKVEKIDNEFSSREGRVSKLEHWQTEVLGKKADRIVIVGVFLAALQIISIILGWGGWTK